VFYVRKKKCFCPQTGEEKKPDIVYRIHAQSDNRYITGIHIPAVCDPETNEKANACLIAASPDLLETVERMTRLLESIERETGYCTAVTQREAYALIAKATGGEE
jgi:hypothetical protein